MSCRACGASTPTLCGYPELANGGEPAEGCLWKPPTAVGGLPTAVGDGWFESAADLLAEGDPGPTPYLVDDLIVDESIAGLVGSSKLGKTFVLLDLSIAVVTGEDALGRFRVAKPGPVLLILEESGRAALHRRLDKLVRGRGIEPARITDLYFAANRRVRLDEKPWRERLLEAAGSREWRLIAFDPLARIKGAVDENVQREIGPVLDFLRDLRAASGSTVAYVHHTPHDGTRHRGSSDLEAYWESKITLTKEKDGRSLRAEHREAEQAGPFRISFGFDATTETLRLRASRDELEERVRDYLEQHPEASANEVYDTIGGNRQRVLDLVREAREGGSESPEPPGTTPAGSGVPGGSAGGAYKAPGTTRADLGTEVVPDGRNHHPAPGDEGYLDWLYGFVRDGWITADEFNRTERIHALIRDTSAGDPEQLEVERLADLARSLEHDAGEGRQEGGHPHG